MEAEVAAVHGTPQLNKALSLLQGEMPKVTKTKTGKIEGQNKAGNYFSYEYSYADLGDVVADMGPLMAKYGLAFHAAPTINPADRREMILIWSLLHESGEERSGEWPLGPVSQKPQSLGSAITYGRRYSFTAATNIVLEDDDDGQRAQQDHSSRQSAGDEFDRAAPARPARENDSPRGTVSRHNGDTPDDGNAWTVDRALEEAASFKTEAAGQQLWRDAAKAHREGRCTRDEADHIGNIIQARIDDRRREASARLLNLLSETDEWRAKAEGLGDDDEARSALEELQQLVGAGQMKDDRAQRIARGIIARWPKAAIKAGDGNA